MKVYYECAPCFLRQAREAMDLATSHEDLKMEITKKILNVVYRDFHRGMVPNIIGTKIHRLIKEETRNNDPYFLERRKCNEIAMKFLPTIENVIKEEGDKLNSYIKASIVGNVIDFGALGLGFNLEILIIQTMKRGLALDHSQDLEMELKCAEDVLYLTDNIGEIVFDRMLIEKFNEYEVQVTVALKEKPILNDACIEDALDVGLNEVAKLMSMGTDSIGIIYEQASDEFRDMFKSTDLVVGKGLGNYEGLTEINSGDKPIFCLLNAKCNPVAKDIGVDRGDNVVLKL